MPKLKHTEIEILKEVLNYPNGAGYVLNFSDRTIGLFFDEEFQINIHDEKYQVNGTSKFKKVLSLLELESGLLGAKILRALWDHRASVIEGLGKTDADHINKRFFQLVQRLQGEDEVIPADAIERFAENETLDELILAIKRDIEAKKPQTALDRLHTYCMKKFAHILSLKGVTIPEDTPLHAKAGLYIKYLESKNLVQNMSLKIMKSNLSVFEDFNYVRNNKSLAHDNDILSGAEARYIFEGISNILRFIRSIEAEKFGQ